MLFFLEVSIVFSFLRTSSCCSSSRITQIGDDWYQGHGKHASTTCQRGFRGFTPKLFTDSTIKSIMRVTFQNVRQFYRGHHVYLFFQVIRAELRPRSACHSFKIFFHKLPPNSTEISRFFLKVIILNFSVSHTRLFAVNFDILSEKRHSTPPPLIFFFTAKDWKP